MLGFWGAVLSRSAERNLHGVVIMNLPRRQGFAVGAVGSVFLLLLLTLLPVTAMGSQWLVGQITAIDHTDRVVEIDGARMSMAPGMALDQEGPPRQGLPGLWRRDLRAGQVIRFQHSGGVVTRMTVLSQYDEVPQ